MKLGIILNRCLLLSASLVFLFSCRSYKNSQLDAKNTLYDRTRLDSIFQESPQDLIIDVSDTKPTFITYGTLNPKKITISKSLVETLGKLYNFTDTKAITEGILSHEYAHVKQLERNQDIFNQEPIAFREFQADFISGFYVSNKYRYKILQKAEPNAIEIFNEICRFIKDRKNNQEMYLMLAMLMNDDKEHTFSGDEVKIRYGMGKDTVQILRFASIWEGFRNSGITSFDEVYRRSLESTQKRIEKKLQDKITQVFQIIGPDIILKILKGDFVFDQDIDSVIKRLDTTKGLVPEEDKIGYMFLLLSLKSNCD